MSEARDKAPAGMDGWVAGKDGSAAAVAAFFKASFQSCAEEVVPPSRSRDAVNNRSFFIGSML